MHLHLAADGIDLDPCLRKTLGSTVILSLWYLGPHRRVDVSLSRRADAAAPEDEVVRCEIEVESPGWGHTVATATRRAAVDAVEAACAQLEVALAAARIGAEAPAPARRAA